MIKKWRKWGVVIMSPKAQKRLKIDGPLKKAKKIALMAKEKYKDRPDVQVYLFSRNDTFAPPEDWRPRKGRHFYWCPYCGKERKFYLNPRWSTYQCPVCTMTTADYYIKLYNRLWEKEVMEAEKKKRRKKADGESQRSRKG